MESLLEAKVQALSQIQNLNNLQSPEEIFKKIHLALEESNLLKPSYPIIIIAGTNGKGSVAHGLSACLKKSEYKIGLFTSPHLFNFNERIRVQDEPADEIFLLEILEKLEPICEKFCLNFFQISFILALKFFESLNLDFGIFEVGLGGRFDPVNCLDPVLSIITSISRDHMEILGDNLEKISWQKLGITRKTVPLLYADKNPQKIILENNQALLTEVYGRDFAYPITWPEPKMARENAAVILRALEYLVGAQLIAPLQIAFCEKNIPYFSAPGRLVWIEAPWGGKVLVDVAHNEDSCRRLAEIIKKNWNGIGKIQAVFSAKPNKDIPAMRAAMASVIDVWHCVGLEEICLDLLELGNLNLHHYAALNQAYEAVKKNVLVGEADLIVCFGSFSVANYILRELGSV